MRITHAIPVYKPAWQFGGPIMSVGRLCEALAKSDNKVRVITTNAGLSGWPEQSLGIGVNEGGVEVTRYKADSQAGIIKSSALQKALPCILQDTDILHISAIWQPLGVAIQRACFQLGIPVVSSLRGALSPYSFSQKAWKKVPYYIAWERPLLQRCSAIHVTSFQEAAELKWQGLKPDIIEIPNPIDLRYYYIDRKLRNDVRARLKVKPETRVLLICGRQHHKKGLDLLPRVLFMNREADWIVLMVGMDEDGSGENFKQMLRKLGLGSRLIAMDTIESNELRGVYNAADLLLVPSRHENFGNVVIEALACGCDIAVSPKTGVAGDLMNSGLREYGAVLPREQDVWSDWMKRWLMSDRQLRTENSEWCRSRYGEDIVASQVLAAYRDILDRQKGPKLS